MVRVDMVTKYGNTINITGKIDSNNAKRFEDKLLAVIDIYQALIEKRSYKKEFNEYDTFAILRQMVKDNFIDGRIVNDLIKVYKK